MNRRFIVELAGGHEIFIKAPDRHKAKAQIARDLVAKYRAPDFKSACNEHIVSCRLAPGEKGARKL
jgi:hypothetical protein